MDKININHTIPIFSKYFHAIALNETETETKNIFKTDAGSVIITPDSETPPYDVVEKFIKPLKDHSVLRPDGDELLIPIRGLLVVPKPTEATKFPLVIIEHGQHRAVDGEGKEVLSYIGYEKFQDHLADNGIASYSVNLFFANLLENNEQSAFEKLALDFNQRVLICFIHLKLLRILAGESIIEPSAIDEFAIKFFNGSTLIDITEAVESTTTPNPDLIRLRAMARRIKFEKLGFMGHSRGADAVSRIPAYFYKNTVFTDPNFPTHHEVHRRIKKLLEQLGKPEQETIKCILALEPAASENKAEPLRHGYVIDSKQTMYFVGVGTHDEDVSLDSVRIYEYPKCPKAMIAINGATHYMFNSIWEKDYSGHDFDDVRTTAHRFSKEQHVEILKIVFGACFIGTLTSDASQLLPFTKEKEFPSKVVSPSDIQCAWKFSFPFENDDGTIDLDPRITVLPLKQLSTSPFKFEQEIQAFYLEKSNDGTFTISIPIDTASGESVSLLGQFGFRFAKGFDLLTRPDRIVENNIVIQLFDNDTPIGKPISGNDITTVELRALEAFDEKTHLDSEGNRINNFEYSIMLQTVEVDFPDFMDFGSISELLLVNRIEVRIIQDETKPPAHSIARGLVGGAFLGATLGGLGALIYMSRFSGEEVQKNANKWAALSAGAGAIVGASGVGLILRAINDKDAFVFKDFLITRSQIPIMPNPQ